MAGDNKQCNCISKKDTNSIIIITESVQLIYIINMKEIVIIDIFNIFYKRV